MNRCISYALVVFLSAAALPLSAMAQEDAHALSTPHDDVHAHDAHAMNWVDFSNPDTPPLVGMFFNFLLVGILVFLILRKGLGGKIRARKTDLETALNEANALRVEAESALGVARARMDAMDDEIQRLQEEMLASGKVQADFIRDDAKSRTLRMSEDTRALVAQEIARMSQQIREEVVDAIIATATARITQKINASDQERLALDYLDSVGGVNAGDGRGDGR